MLYSHVSKKLIQLLLEIEQGSLALPELQRPFLWKDTNVKDLLDSLFKGYPIGFLMLWDTNSPEKAKNIGTENKVLPPRQLIIDGQQRLTSLFSVLRGKKVKNEKFQEKAIVISFNPLKKEFKVGDKVSEKSKEWIFDISSLFLTKNIVTFVNNFTKELRTAKPDLSEEEENAISKNIGDLKNIENTDVHCFQIPIDADEEEVSDIFVRVNSGGKKLTESDFILTLISLHWADGRTKIENFCEDSRKIPLGKKVSSYNSITIVDTTNLVRTALAYGFDRARLKYGYKLLRGADFEQKGMLSIELRNQRFDKLKLVVEDIIDLNNWHNFLITVMSAGFIEASLISSSSALFYCYSFYLIAKKRLSATEAKLKILMPKFIFFVFLTNRYSSSFETQMEQDLNILKEFKTSDDLEQWIENLKTNILTDAYFSVTLASTPNTYLSVADKSGTSPLWLCYCAALNVLDSGVLFSKTSLKIKQLFAREVNGKRKAIERHHLFPENFLKTIGTQERLINQIGNFAFIDWVDNMDILDEDPKIYFPEIKRKFKTEELKKMLEENALPDNWHNLDYETFLEERRKLMSAIIKKAIDKLFS